MVDLFVLADLFCKFLFFGAFLFGWLYLYILVLLMLFLSPCFFLGVLYLLPSFLNAPFAFQGKKKIKNLQLKNIPTKALIGNIIRDPKEANDRHSISLDQQRSYTPKICGSPQFFLTEHVFRQLII